ncbi:hypothetical protein [Nocardioides sp.]|uniref:hypothetical protein n=1 Tax=Nocardioides sp. TaxID=35761 RepID=UPI003511D8AC
MTPTPARPRRLARIAVLAGLPALTAALVLGVAAPSGAAVENERCGIACAGR